MRMLIVSLMFCALPALALEPCNGSPDFCQLPLDAYVWPGTHNSGSSKKVSPGGSSFLVKVGRCFFDNHERNYKEQLDAGVRLLAVDFCVKDNVVINCHFGNDMRTEGEAIAASLVTVRTWLEANPRDMVVWTIDNGRDGGTAHFETSIQETFGGCLETNAALALREASGERALGCLRWPGILQSGPDILNVSEVTLGRAIAADLRFVYGASCCGRIMGSTWHPDFKITSPESIGNHFRKVARGEVPGMPRDGHKLVWAQVGYQGSACKKAAQKQLNMAALPANSVAPRLKAPGVSCGKGCDCEGYRSELEVMQQVLFARHFRLGAVVVDFTKYGELAATTARMSHASLRLIKGVREACKMSVSGSFGCTTQASAFNTTSSEVLSTVHSAVLAVLGPPVDPSWLTLAVSNKTSDGVVVFQFHYDVVVPSDVSASITNIENAAVVLQSERFRASLFTTTSTTLSAASRSRTSPPALGTITSTTAVGLSNLASGSGSLRDTLGAWRCMVLIIALVFLGTGGVQACEASVRLESV